MQEYFKNIYYGLATAFTGMKITFKHLFTKSVTIQYPEVKPAMVPRVRNRLYVNMDDCIGCDQCARACPVDCITIETVKALPTDDLGKTSQGKKKALWVTQFDIDIAKCCFCQLCVFPCPTECIYMTDTYEFSEYKRENLLYTFSTLTPEEVVEKKENFAKMEAEKAAAKAAAPKPAPVAKPADGAAPAAPKPVAPKPVVTPAEAPKAEETKPEAPKAEVAKPEPVKAEEVKTETPAPAEIKPEPAAEAKSETPAEPKAEEKKDTPSTGNEVQQ